jgi:nitrogen fixation NifU-like protein
MEYTDKVIDHFKNPRNVGEIENADGIGKVGNLKCGDVMYIYIRVGTRIKNQNAKIKMQNLGKDSIPNEEIEEYIEDIKFKTLGCAAAVAASSMTTELVKGKSLKEAYNITRDDINDSLGKLPAQKYHCSILSADGIKKAIDDYRGRNRKG